MLIINNDTGPNAASDSACGTYVSGETEDFVVIFRNATSSVKNIQSSHKVNIYPNPVGNEFTIDDAETGAIFHISNIWDNMCTMQL